MSANPQTCYDIVKSFCFFRGNCLIGDTQHSLNTRLSASGLLFDTGISVSPAGSGLRTQAISNMLMKCLHLRSFLFN